ncbi:MAG: ParA family protein [Planctomycetaceae bacterium]|nr:ParA family protein [Planctomycetaceae bacterium]
MTVIAVTNSKGGVGKSTLAVHLAVWLHEQGHRVILADCDAQHSSSEWMNEACPDIECVRLNGADEVVDELPRLIPTVDYVVADGPGSDTDTSRTILMFADLAIFPCKASMLEARALAQATKVLRLAHAVRRDKPRVVIVQSMVGRKYRLTKDMAEAAKALDLPQAETQLVLRQVYADAPGRGAVVWQLGSRAREASREIRRLFTELVPEAVKPRKTGKSKRKRTEAA